jgi:hypothetical protein
LRAADITSDRHTWSSDEDFPPQRPRDQENLPGFEMRPNGAQVVQILLGIQLSRPGQHGFRSVAVLYHVGNRDYRYVYPSGVSACSQSSAPITECDAQRLFGR